MNDCEQLEQMQEDYKNAFPVDIEWLIKKAIYYERKYTNLIESNRKEFGQDNWY